jgi:UDP-N-acetylmuramoylalanine--D-glutamate ligase
MKISELKDKTVAIVGYGVEGHAAARFLREHGIAFAVLDRNVNLEIPDDAVRADLGEEYLKNLSDYDVIIRAPGIRPFLPEFVAYQKQGGIMQTQVKLFFDNYPHPERVIGITGTKGKGTTALLIQKILEEAKMPVVVAGNIGLGVLDLLNEKTATENPWIILELSSFQLQDCEASPHIAVVLMVTADHLDYHASVQEYVAAKSAIGRYQSADDAIVINADYENSLAIGQESKAHKYLFSTVTAAIVGDEGVTSLSEEGEIAIIHGGKRRGLGNIADLKLRGHHNTQNICAAALVGTLVGASDMQIWNGCKNFSGYAHRLQLVADRHGVQFYDDSIATVPESALTAIDSFSEPVVLFAGGSDKGGDYEAFGRALASRPGLKAVAALGTVGWSIIEGLRAAQFRGMIIQSEEQGPEAYDRAFAQLEPVVHAGDVVVLSPGTASFDMFENYKERGDYFTGLAKEFTPKGDDKGTEG